MGALAVVSTVNSAVVGAWTPEPGYMTNAWVTVAANGTALRLPLSTWAESGPPGTPDVPEQLGLMRAVEAFYLTNDCSGPPFFGTVTLDANNMRVPGIRTVLLSPIAGTRNIRYYDATFVTNAPSRTAFSHVAYDTATATFICHGDHPGSQELAGVGALLFDSSVLPPEPYRIQ